MRDEIVEVGSVWQHFKGDQMKIVAIATHSETLEEMIIYEHQKKIWARPISIFLSDEDISSRLDNQTGQKYRFEKIKEENHVRY